MTVSANSSAGDAPSARCDEWHSIELRKSFVPLARGFFSLSMTTFTIPSGRRAGLHTEQLSTPALPWRSNKTSSDPVGSLDIDKTACIVKIHQWPKNRLGDDVSVMFSDRYPPPWCWVHAQIQSHQFASRAHRLACSRDGKARYSGKHGPALVAITRLSVDHPAVEDSLADESARPNLLDLAPVWSLAAVTAPAHAPPPRAEDGAGGSHPALPT